MNAKRLQHFYLRISDPWIHPLVLLIVAILAFGVLIPWLGFYWDDWPKAWFLHELGPAGFDQVYGADRPNLAWTYLLTTSIVGENPIGWQIFGLLARWLSAVALWWTLLQVWPKRRDVAAIASLIFLVFPGFSQQHISLIYSHFLFLQAAHILSLGLMVRAIRRPHHRVLLTGFSIATALYSLLSIEYYFGLELLRPLLIYLSLSDELMTRRARLRQTLRYWLPYVPILPIFLIWRTQVIGYPTYEPTLLSRILAQPIGVTIEELSRLILADTVQTIIGSWLRILPIPTPSSFGMLSTILYLAVMAIVFVLSAIYLYRATETGERDDLKIAGAILVMGFWAILVSGWPFWLTDLPLRMSFPNDRFMLAFMLGGSLVAVGIIVALGSSPRTRVLAIGLTAILVAIGAGQQIRYATEYRRERESQTNLLWQFMWRVPDLEAGTTVLVNELPLAFDDDEAVTGAVNWIYGENESPGQMHFFIADLRLRLGRSIASLQEDAPIHKEYRATVFDGTTSQVIVMAYDPPKCLRVYDVVLHDSLPGIPEPLPDAIPLSNPDLILADSDRALDVPRHVIGPEPPHHWCYFFQRADLAAQQQDWARVAELGDQAFALDDRPNDASERLPFIEGYARVGRWDDAANLSLDVFNEQPPMATTVCRTWIRLEHSTEGGENRGSAFDRIFNTLPCDKLREEASNHAFES